MTEKFCKICGCKQKTLLFNLCSNMKIMGSDFPKSQSNVVECPNCGFVYVDMEAEQKDFNKYYTSPSSNPLSYYELYGKEHTDQYFNTILDKFDKYIDKDAEILDFAGGTGDFIKFLTEKGYKNSYNLELSEKCCNLSEEKGAKSILGDCCNEDIRLDKKFDIITMIHSIEHFMDIDKAIVNAKKLLKPKGYLYIEIPDAEKYSNTDAVPYTMYTYEHIYHFTLDTMDNIGRAFGLNLINKAQFFKAGSYDVLYALYQNGGEILPVTYNDFSKKSILEYKEFSKKKIKPFIDEFEKTQQKLILWGIGASTALLLNGTFDNCNVIQLIDRNPSRQGLEYKIGNKIYSVASPSDIIDNEAIIIVLPYWYHDSIMKQIKDMKFKNPVKALMK